MPRASAVLIVNPASRGSPPVPRLLESEKGIRDAFREILVLGRDGPMCSIIERARRRAGEAGLLVVCGGDGTVQGVASELLGASPEMPRPALFLLPAGGHNNLARNLGLPAGDPERVLRRLAERLLQGETPATRRVRAETIMVNGRHGFVFCNGMAYGFLADYLALGGRGAKDVARLTASWLVRIGRGVATGRPAFPPLRATLRVDHRTIEKRAFSLLIASTVPSLGFGFRPCFRAGSAPGRFHLVAPPAAASILALRIQRFFRGLPIVDPDSIEILAREATIELSEPAGYVLDGELVEAAAAITIQAGPAVSIAAL